MQIKILYEKDNREWTLPLLCYEYRLNCLKTNLKHELETTLRSDYKH